MATEHERSEFATGGLSRRQVLARGAVAAGVVWAAPVIRTASAYATSAAGTERPCTKFYLVCLDVAGPRPIRFDDPDWEYDEMPADDVLARFRPGGDPAPSTSTTTSSTTTTSTSSTSSTTTSSTSSTTTSSTTTTTTTRPAFDDPTEGLGLFPGDEADTDPRDKKKKQRRDTKRDKDKKAKNDDDDSADDAVTAAGTGAAGPAGPAADELGLFPDETDGNAIADAATAAPLPDELPPAIADWLRDNPDVPLRYPEIPPMLTQTGEQAWAVLLPEVESGPNPLTHQCRAVKGWSNSGKSHGEFYVDPHPGLPDEEGRRLIFPNPRFDSSAEPPLIDKVFLVYCCP